MTMNEYTDSKANHFSLLFLLSSSWWLSFVFYHQFKHQDSIIMVDYQIVCSMCGDVGFPDKLFRCNKCCNRFQHSYELPFTPTPQVLICSWQTVLLTHLIPMCFCLCLRDFLMGSEGVRSEIIVIVPCVHVLEIMFCNIILSLRVSASIKLIRN